MCVKHCFQPIIECYSVNEHNSKWRTHSIRSDSLGKCRFHRAWAAATGRSLRIRCIHHKASPRRRRIGSSRGLNVLRQVFLTLYRWLESSVQRSSVVGGCRSWLKMKLFTWIKTERINVLWNIFHKTLLLALIKFIFDSMVVII